MHIVHIATELKTIAEISGLGSSVYGLCKELARARHLVEIILPYYDVVNQDALSGLELIEESLPTLENGKHVISKVYSAYFENLKIILIAPKSPLKYFERGAIYGQDDDPDRFTLFSMAAMEFLHRRRRAPDTLHLHNWQTSICALLYKEIYQPLNFEINGIVLSLHTLEEQGRCGAETLCRLGLAGGDFLDSRELGDPTYTHTINLLKGGILYADLLITDSSTYRSEILATEKACGLGEELRAAREKLYAVEEGIDYEMWNPETSPYLTAPYSITKGRGEAIMAGKAVNKHALQQQLGLAESDDPLFCTICRLTPQKAPHLIERAIKTALSNGGQFVFLGTTENREIKAQFIALKKEMEATYKGRAAIVLEYNEPLAQLIYAGADATIIPSLYEPGGSAQIAALRYGTLPIVRRTGGLAATISDYKNGFTFDPATKEGVSGATMRALSCFKDHRAKWHEMVAAGGLSDFSWKQGAAEYLKLYNELSTATL